MIKPKLWNGFDLKGSYLVSYKIDGVRMLRDTETDDTISRSSKPLYNLDNIPSSIKDAEVYLDNWETSVSLVRTKNTNNKVTLDCVYSLEPLDKRLIMEEVIQNPSKDLIEKLLNKALSYGYEGLVLRSLDKTEWIKVKPCETYDVKVLGVIEGTGKYKGMLGALMTEKGKVGTGFSDEIRKSNIDWIGSTIEVKCMHLTKNGKFRNPVFLRQRWDK